MQWSIIDRLNMYSHILSSIEGKSGRVKTIKFIHIQESNVIEHISFYYYKGNIISCPPSLFAASRQNANSFSDSFHLHINNSHSSCSILHSIFINSFIILPIQYLPIIIILQLISYASCSFLNPHHLLKFYATLLSSIFLYTHIPSS